MICVRYTFPFYVFITILVAVKVTQQILTFHTFSWIPPFFDAFYRALFTVTFLTHSWLMKGLF